MIDTGLSRASALQKIIAALRYSAWDTGRDYIDDYLPLSSTMALLSLRKFCTIIERELGNEYLCRPYTKESRVIEKKFTHHGFFGCVGVLDCSGWRWINCPKALSDTMKGKDREIKLKNELICEIDPRMWHAFVVYEML